MSEFSVYVCGQKVLIGECIPGLVSAVCVRGSTVTYEVKWFDNNSMRCEWLESFMVKPAGDAKKMRIGFSGEL